MTNDKLHLSQVDITKNPLENYSSYVRLKNTLEKLGIYVETQSVDINDFKIWMKNFPNINNMYKGLGDVYIEKCLEHYLSYKVLDFNDKDVFIDIAASGSVFADELARKHKVQTYLLDLAYPAGINGNRIGADACKTNLPDNFADTLGMHCAYECFEKDADIGFLEEANRILKPNGRLVITPLYIDEIYYNCTSAECDQSKIGFDNNAMKVWRDDEYIAPFSRHYSPEIFHERVFNNIPAGMSGKIIFYTNLPELMEEYKNQRIYCYFLFICKKK